MFILLIGSDARSNTYNVGLADAIRIVRVDFMDPGVQALAFPRDLYVEIPGIESHGGITHGKLNQAFLYGNPGYGYTDDPDLGPGLLADTLELNFGASSGHYISANLQTFTKAIDAIGGIDIDLPYVVDGRVKGSKDINRYFPAGKQHLNGYRTMLLARMRPNGDIQRSEVQNLILKALASKVLTLDVIPRLPELAETFRGSVQTNITAVTAENCSDNHLAPSCLSSGDHVVRRSNRGPHRRLSRVKSPAIRASFLCRVHRLSCRSRARACA
jgi:LCP family protein required for cell wall assembly